MQHHADNPCPHEHLTRELSPWAARLIALHRAVPQPFRVRVMTAIVRARLRSTDADFDAFLSRLEGAAQLHNDDPVQRDHNPNTRRPTP